MKLDGVQVLVDVKFIKTLNNFIMTSIKPLTKPIPLKSKSGTELQESKSGTELQESKPGTEPPEYETLKPETHSVSSKPKSETVDAGTKSAETSKITVRVVVTKPRIALLESSEQSNSSALVLGVSSGNLGGVVFVLCSQGQLPFMIKSSLYADSENYPPLPCNM